MTRNMSIKYQQQQQYCWFPINTLLQKLQRKNSFTIVIVLVTIIIVVSSIIDDDHFNIVTPLVYVQSLQPIRILTITQHSIRRQNHYDSILTTRINFVDTNYFYKRIYHQIGTRCMDLTVTAASSTSTTSTDNYAQGLLYKEQESMLQQRGIYEEELMKNNYTPIQTYPIPINFQQSLSKGSGSKGGSGFGSKGGSGFGGAGTSTKKNSNKKDTSISSIITSKSYDIESSWYATILQEHGVVRIDNVLPTTTITSTAIDADTGSSIPLVDELRQFVLSLRKDSIQKVIIEQTIQSSDRFADVLLRTNRCDLKIPLMGTSTTSSCSTSSSNDNVIERYNIHTNNTHIIEKALLHILTKTPIANTIQKLFDTYNKIDDNSNNIDSKQKSTKSTKKTSALSTQSSSTSSTSSSSSSSPVLYELSTLISDPGSYRQNIHPDTPIVNSNNNNLNTNKNRVPVLVTCFIALQDITIDMGPTVWLPGTHTEEYHKLFFQDTIIPTTTTTDATIINNNNMTTATDQHNNSINNVLLSPKDTLLQTHPAVLGILPKGCCAIYDSRILHCGSANKRQQQQQSQSQSSVTESDQYGFINDNNNTRAIFYFSFRNPTILYPGNPPSIRTEIGQSKVTMEQLQQYLHQAITMHEANDNTILHEEATIPKENPFPWNR